MFQRGIDLEVIHSCHEKIVKSLNIVVNVRVVSKFSICSTKLKLFLYFRIIQDHSVTPNCFINYRF